ncbi:protein phosphatase 2C domain-containing protein [Serratia proteamaculans]
MMSDITVQHKVLSLLLADSQLSLADAELAALSEDKAVGELLDELRKRLHAAGALSVSAEELPAAEVGLASAPDHSTAETTAEAPLADPAVEEPGAETAVEAECAEPVVEDASAEAVAEVQHAEPVVEDRADESAEKEPAPVPATEAPGWQKMDFPEITPASTLPPAALKPGEVPVATTRAPSPPLRTPQAKINVANARVGTLFHSEIDITLDNGALAQIEKVQFGVEVGLTFDAQNASISGIPTQSGDIDLTVTWSCPTFPSCISHVLLIINPDPRSLWKVIDPPADDRYFKKNVDFRQIRESNGLIVAASRRGRSHEHVGSFRDDDFFISSDAQTGWNILLVADGAGSAKNSRQGSRIVTETVGQYLTAQLAGEKGRELQQRITQWSPDDRRVVGETFIRQFHHASVMAINNINNASMMVDEPIKSYATTLLACVSFRAGNELFAAAFWMGDGAIAAYGPKGKVRILGTPDSGEYAGQTRFLDADAVQDPEFSKRVSIGKWSDVSHLILMTDGVSDPRFETDNGLLQEAKWDALVSELSGCLRDDPQSAERMADWLNFFSPGNHDDRTLVVSCCADTLLAAE